MEKAFKLWQLKKVLVRHTVSLDVYLKSACVLNKPNVSKPKKELIS